ncbi:sugar ABC transporter ATP-binding protein [Nesterenkonia cremea]|uniref:Sugar ABC transporter ATP-binding protein n=1 Tax=Nesterenkonia cremea TaxID=1882340 RepID=A0A917AKR9_9MICC|nr:sugar ABC transporter ATP-binding protein [Nesterenkonia cremea]GGE58752.1 sugar ABC transporter ATP-binding protein [Nesterenkonia cremea]
MSEERTDHQELSPTQNHDGADVVLRAVGISKTYGVTRALKGVNFEVRAGEVTVLFGENGAGKSTLMKILSGVETPTAGHLELDGEQVTLASTSAAVDRGISIIHQELNLNPNLKVRDNIFLGREKNSWRGIDYAEQSRITAEVMERLEEPISPDTYVQDLRVGQQQIIEIARALSTDARILIMDEPTSALSTAEVTVLFKIIRELKRQGVAIVYISHHLEEAIEIADRAVVFRDGELVAAEDAADIDLLWVVRTMVGRDADYDFREEPREHGGVALSIRDVSVADPISGKFPVDHVSLDVHQGEIVCLYGLMGAGRTELMEALAGRDQLAGGQVLLGEKDLRGTGVARRIELGVGLVPEDRQRDGLIQMQSVGKNLSLASLSSWVGGGLLRRGAETRAVSGQISGIGVKTAGPEAPISSLSGGNAQKVVIGKMLLTDPTVLLLDEPTRGVDVGAKGEIFSLLFQQAQKGLAVLFATSDVGEALTASHRIVVMSRGRTVRSFDPRTATREEVMAAAEDSTGASPGAPEALSTTGSTNGAQG